MRVIIQCIILISLTLGSVYAQNDSTNIDPRLAGLEEKIEEIIDTWSLPGVAIAIVEKDSVIFEKGFGYRDIKNKKPVTIQTLFPIASNTKAFTSAMVGQLVEEEKLNIQDSPNKYLPNLEFHSPLTSSALKIDDIMSHKSGLAAHNMSLILFPPEHRENLIQRIRHLEASSSLRAEFTYNNLLYSVLGLLIENGAEQKWETVLKNRIFTPLEMYSSNSSITALTSSSDFALGYDDELNFAQTDFFAYSGWEPGGGINSNAHEMANWMIAWINGGLFKNQQIIPEQFISEALSLQTIISSSVPRKTGSNFFSGYGYGWILQNYYGHYRAHHQGGARGFSAMTTIFPNDSIGIVVLTNEYGSWTNSVIRDLVSNRMLGLESQDLNQLYWKAYQRQNNQSEESQPEDAPVQQEILIKEAKKYLGTFSHLGYGQIKIVLEQKDLIAKFPNNNFLLKKIGNNVYYLSGKTTADEDMLYYMETHDVPREIEFEFDEDQKIKLLKMKLEPQLERAIQFTRME